MTERGPFIDLFEARVAASLERLADEVPTDVDAVELTATLASAATGPRWLPRRMSGWATAIAPVLRLVLVVMAVLALLHGAAVLGPRPIRTPIPSPIHGLITCDGGPWTTSMVDSVTLDCVSSLPDPRLAGTVRITLDDPAQSGGTPTRTGSMELQAGGATWEGWLRVTTTPNGMAVGGAVLVGQATAQGVVLDLRLMSSDGRDWGVLATTTESRQPVPSGKSLRPGAGLSPLIAAT